MNEFDKQKGLGDLIQTLDEEISKLTQKKRNARKELDESVRLHGDLILKTEKAKELELWRESRKNLPPTDPEFLSELKKKNDAFMEKGVKLGFWESVENGIPIPHAITIPLSILPANPTMAHLLVHVGIFDSLGQARKAGRTEPLKVGEVRIKMKEGGMKRFIVE